MDGQPICIILKKHFEAEIGTHFLKGPIPQYTQQRQENSREVINLLPGYYRLNNHMRKIGSAEGPNCMFCQIDEKTPCPLLCRCEALGEIKFACEIEQYQEPGS